MSVACPELVRRVTSVSRSRPGPPVSRCGAGRGDTVGGLPVAIKLQYQGADRDPLARDPRGQLGDRVILVKWPFLVNDLPTAPFGDPTAPMYPGHLPVKRNRTDKPLNPARADSGGLAEPELFTGPGDSVKLH